MDIRECTKKGIIRKTRVDTHLARSIIEMSEIKMKIVSESNLDQSSINGFLPMAYDSLREILEALCILHGYKVSNHECLGRLAKELDDDFDPFSFDRFRYARNGINYYGNKVGLEEGKMMIKSIFLMRERMITKIDGLPEMSGARPKKQ